MVGVGLLLLILAVCAACSWQRLTAPEEQHSNIRFTRPFPPACVPGPQALYTCRLPDRSQPLLGPRHSLALTTHGLLDLTASPGLVPAVTAAKGLAADLTSAWAMSTAARRRRGSACSSQAGQPGVLLPPAPRAWATEAADGSGGGSTSRALPRFWLENQLGSAVQYVLSDALPRPTSPADGLMQASAGMAFMPLVSRRCHFQCAASLALLSQVLGCSLVNRALEPCPGAAGDASYRAAPMRDPFDGRRSRPTAARCPSSWWTPRPAIWPGGTSALRCSPAAANTTPPQVPRTTTRPCSSLPTRGALQPAAAAAAAAPLTAAALRDAPCTYGY